ncbi:hypothetical protein OIO90_005523 [Microbotryomycetes sp. JL221]|nr:hypothetical protein OIO90_005523 [Microbotryomycetes sp. JL221]
MSLLWDRVKRAFRPRRRHNFKRERADGFDHAASHCRLDKARSKPYPDIVNHSDQEQDDSLHDKLAECENELVKSPIDRSDRLHKYSSKCKTRSARPPIDTLDHQIVSEQSCDFRQELVVGICKLSSAPTPPSSRVGSPRGSGPSSSLAISTTCTRNYSHIQYTEVQGTHSPCSTTTSFERSSSSSPSAPASPTTPISSTSGHHHQHDTLESPHFGFVPLERKLSPTQHRRRPSRSSTRSVWSSSASCKPIHEVSPHTTVVVADQGTALNEIVASGTKFARRVSLYVASQAHRPPSSLSKVNRSRTTFGVGAGEDTSSDEEAAVTNEGPIESGQEDTDGDWVASLKLPYDPKRKAQQVSFYRLDNSRAVLSDSELGHLKHDKKVRKVNMGPDKKAPRPSHRRHSTIDVDFLDDDDKDEITLGCDDIVLMQRRPGRQLKPILTEFESIASPPRSPTLSSPLARTLSVLSSKSIHTAGARVRPLSVLKTVDEASQLSLKPKGPVASALTRSKSLTSSRPSHLSRQSRQLRHSFSPLPDFNSFGATAVLSMQDTDEPQSPPSPTLTRFQNERDKARGVLRVTNGID